MEFKAIAEWTLFEEAPIPDDVYPLLTAGGMPTSLSRPSATAPFSPTSD